MKGSIKTSDIDHHTPQLELIFKKRLGKNETIELPKTNGWDPRVAIFVK